MNIGVTYKAAGELTVGNGAVLYGYIFNGICIGITCKNTQAAVACAMKLVSTSLTP